METIRKNLEEKANEVQQATMDGVGNLQEQATNLQGQVTEGVGNLQEQATTTVGNMQQDATNTLEAVKQQKLADENHPDGALVAGLNRLTERGKKFVNQDIPYGVEQAKEAGKQANTAAKGAFVKTQAEYEKNNTPTESPVEGQQPKGPQEVSKGGRRRRKKRRKSKRWPRKKSKSKRKKSRRRRKKKGGKKSRKKKRRRSRKKTRRRRRR
jgi:hypothetical protein